MALKARIENGIVYSPYPSESSPEISLYQAMKQSLEQHGNRTALVFLSVKSKLTTVISRVYDVDRLCLRMSASYLT